MSNVRDFGASGDGMTDDTEAVIHALEQGDGTLEFPPGTYLLTRTVSVDLDKLGRFGMSGSSGTAKLLMAGPGPAFHFIGTHGGTADPGSVKPNVWQHQRLPLVREIEIEGRHAKADGFLVEGCMQPTFQAVLLRNLQHGIRLAKRNRNLIVNGCHIYNLSGLGIHFDAVNLHQAIIADSHISYCKRGGIKINGSEIRNLQITGNDIEYNYENNVPGCCDVLIDCSDGKSTVREGTLASNTIQARYSVGGANVRILGKNAEQSHQAGMWTISGNLIGSQETNVHLVSCRAVTVSGNVIYSGFKRNLLIESSRNIVVGPNSFDHNPDYTPKELCTGVRLAGSRDVTLTGLMIHDCQAPTYAPDQQTPRTALLEIEQCQRVTASGCHILDGKPYGLAVAESSSVSVTGCTITNSGGEALPQGAVRWTGPGQTNLLANCIVGRGSGEPLAIDPQADVQVAGNVVGP